ncbi:putative capsule polysaccharide biosynthesis [Rosellinia necatrix]|uniref:Putative capsule polysaccharide biosynthesis n=1 Tax=Rosellinia necatrix TaxID=77044 RepID=A0A1W2TG45_ROSNE|nr:putative capsule polysaccharide biosynthesis [Rosellinia necatrix]
MDFISNSARSAPWATPLVGVVALLFAAANLKSIPFYHTLHTLPSLYRLLKPRFRTRGAKACSDAPVANPPTESATLFKHYATRSRVTITDLDINLHKSNSTFFLDADNNRAALLTKLLSEGLATTGPSIFILAGVACKFRQEIRPFQAYTVSSRILAWNDQSLYVVTYFLKPGVRLPAEIDVLGSPSAVLKDDKYRKSVFAVMVTKYVFKAGRRTVPPEEVLRSAGFAVSGGGGGASKSEGGYGDDSIDYAIKSGLEYVRGCME